MNAPTLCLVRPPQTRRCERPAHLAATSQSHAREAQRQGKARACGGSANHRPLRSMRHRGRRRQSLRRRREQSRPFFPAKPASRAGAAAIHSPIRSSFNPRCCIAVHITGSARPRLADSAPRLVPPAFFAALHLRRARGVVCSHHFDQPTIERVPKSLAIRSVADRRRAFEFRRAIGNFFSWRTKGSAHKFLRSRARHDLAPRRAAAGPLRWINERYEWEFGIPRQAE